MQTYKFRIRSKSDTGKQTHFVWGTSPEEARSAWFKAFGKMAPASTPLQIRYAPITPADLKYLVENRGKESHFFSRENMRFSGDTMRNYGVRSQPVIVQTYAGPVLSWELYRKRPVKHGLFDSAFFDVQTLGQVFQYEPDPGHLDHVFENKGA